MIQSIALSSSTKNIVRVLYTIFLCCITAGCEKELDFKYEEIPPLKVIEANLSPDGIRTSIMLTTPMDEPMNTGRLTDARVTLTDLTTSDTYMLCPDEEGYFINSAPGKPGDEYRLDVDMGDIRYSSTATMYDSVEIINAEFAWIKMPYDDVAVLQCQYLDNPAQPHQCYWVRVYRNGEIYQWNVQKDTTAENGVMNFFAMTTRRDTESEDESDLLVDGDIVTISVTPISLSMHDYLEALGNDSSGPRLFSAALLNPQEGSTYNVNNDCLGYFLASSTSSIELVFQPDRIPYAE